MSDDAYQTPDPGPSYRTSPKILADEERVEELIEDRETLIVAVRCLEAAGMDTGSTIEELRRIDDEIERRTGRRPK